MSNQAQNSKEQKKYDLIDRTSKFGAGIIIFVKKLPYNPINNPLISQLIRSATSIGANYREADCAESKRDFNHRIVICKKESKETVHWLEMIKVANPNFSSECDIFKQEAHEFTLIFSAILNSSKKIVILI